jgi:hypothetical protein
LEKDEWERRLLKDRNLLLFDVGSWKLEVKCSPQVDDIAPPILPKSIKISLFYLSLTAIGGQPSPKSDIIRNFSINEILVHSWKRIADLPIASL